MRQLTLGVLGFVCVTAAGCSFGGGEPTVRMSSLVSNALLKQEEHCADLWDQSNMEWGEGGWQAAITLREGRCEIRLGNLAQNAVFECWETQWSAIQCGSHGGWLDSALQDPDERRRLRWNGVIRNGHLVLADLRARLRTPAARSGPPLVEGYVQPFERGRLRPEIRPVRRYTGSCFTEGYRMSEGNYGFRCGYGHYVAEPCIGPKPTLSRGDVVYCAEGGSTEPTAIEFAQP